MRQTLASPAFASSTAFFSTSMWADSWFTLTMATARNDFDSAMHRSRTRATTVSAGRLTVPGNSAASWDTEKVTGGMMSA